MRRTALASLWLVVLGGGGLLAIWRAGVTAVPFDWLWAYTPWLYLPVWFVVLAALFLGARLLAAASGAVAAAHLAVLWPAMSGGPSDRPPDLRVVSANVYVANPDVGRLAGELLATDADVLVLQEVTPSAFAVLERALGPTYPSHATMLRDDPLGAAIFARDRLGDESIVDVAGWPMLTATIEVGGRAVRLWDVHTLAPSSRIGRHGRDAMLDAMSALRAAEDLPLLAVGDYNATPWQRAFAALLDRADLRDAHDLAGRGLAGTWKRLPLEPLIDHVLVSQDWSVVDVRQGDGAGSDHRPVIVDVAL